MAFEGSPAQYYRDRAKELREIAVACCLPDIKAQLEEIARQYDQLAKQAAKGYLR